MYTTVRFNNVAHLTRLERKRGIFEWLLHLTGPKPAKVSSLPCGGAITVLLSQRGELLFVPSDLGLVPAEDGYSFFL
jgi:hypothetical protein